MVFVTNQSSGQLSMNAQLKAKPDDTRARIIETAETLFRRLGFAKTAVADIAADLGMSPANVYRFFASKNAIVEAICQRCLSELDAKAWAVARSRGSAANRLEKLFLEVLDYHRDNLITEKRVHDMVLVTHHTIVIQGVVPCLPQHPIRWSLFRCCCCSQAARPTPRLP